MKDFNKYLTISDLEKQWGFYVTTAGYSKVGSHQSYPDNNQHPKSHAFNWDNGRILDGYYVIFISKGKGIFETKKTKLLNISEGCCIVLFPGVWHRYKPDFECGWEEYWIGFKGTFAAELIKRFFQESNPVFQIGNRNDNVFKLYLLIIEKIKSSKPGYHQEIAGITHQLLGILKSLSETDQGSANSIERLISDGKFLLRENLQEQGKIENIIQALPVSYSKFRKDFKKVTGQSPNQYLLDLKLSKVKELLSVTNLSMKEIAYQTGFDSISYMSKIFKKKNGVSPNFYRLQLR